MYRLMIEGHAPEDHLENVSSVYLGFDEQIKLDGFPYETDLLCMLDNIQVASRLDFN